MKFVKPVLFVAVLVLMTVVGLGAAFIRYSRAAEAPQGILDGTTSHVLIEEIRSLRQALQESTTGNARVQLAIERCRLQQSMVGRLSDEYNLIQSQIDGSDDTIQQMEATAKSLEYNLAIETEPARRSEIEREQKMIATNVEQNKQRVQRLQERSAQVSGMLLSERAKLDEIMGLLDTLDRQVAGRQSGRK